MPDRVPRICVFGDSHYACLKQAEGRGLADISGLELEYWGHVGTRFRYLTVRDGAIHPLDDFTARRFAKFNTKGRLFLPAADFDAILVMGARVYVGPVFLMLLHAQCHGPFISRGLMRRILADRLRGQAGYRLAAGLAATGTAQIVLAPVSFPIRGPQPMSPLVTEAVMAMSADQRSEIWAALISLAKEDGITLLPQPEESVAGGCFTRADYAVDGHVAKNDYEHKNPAYGAVVWAQALPILRQAARRGPALAAAGGGLQDGDGADGVMDA
jgi:hypothetical protein